MAWYDSVSGLSATNAWDVLNHDATGALVASVGGVDCGSWPAKEVVFGAFASKGNGSAQILASRVALPTDYTLAYFFSHDGSGLEVLYDSSSGSELWFSSGSISSRRSSTASLGPVPSGVVFFALIKDSSGCRAYVNGGWAGSAGSVSAAPSHMKEWGYSPSGGYNFYSDDAISAVGIFDSAATLAQLQDLESAVRGAMAPVFNSRVANQQAQRQPLLASVPATYNSALKNPIAPRLPTGAGVVVGSVAEKGTPPAPNAPVVRRVVCIDEATGVQVGSTWSAADGSYAFGGLDPSRRVTVLAYDHTDHYRAVVADKLLPVLPN